MTTDTIFVIISMESNAMSVKSYASLKRLCREHGFNHKEIRDKLPFKYKNKIVLKSELENGI
jgi:hypothetical protein